MNLLYEKDVDKIIDSLQEVRHIVEDEGYETNTDGFLKLTNDYKKNGIEELNFCINKRCKKDEFESEELEEFIDRLKDLLVDYNLNFDKKYATGRQIYMNIFISKKRTYKYISVEDSIKGKKLNESLVTSWNKWIKDIVDTIERLKYIVEDEGYRVLVDITGHAPVFCYIQKKLDKDWKYTHPKKYIPYSISGYGSDESIEEFIDRLKEEIDCTLKIDNNNNNISIKFYEKQLKMFEGKIVDLYSKSKIDELECSYPPIPLTRNDIEKIKEVVKELRYIIEDERYITNFDQLETVEFSGGSDVNLYISKHTSDITNGLFSEELEEFIERLIDSLPSFYFGSYGNTLRIDNLRHYISHHIRSNGSGILYFTFYIYKRKKSNLNESIDHLKQRGLNQNTKFIYDELSGDTFFFLYNLSGQITGYQKYNERYPKTGQNRLDDPRKAKYFIWAGDEGSGKKLAVWGLETTKIDDKYLFITEGIFDCVKIHNAGYPGIAVLCNDPSGSMRNWLNSLPQKKIVIYDNDRAGRRLRSVGNYSFCVPGDNKDLGDLTQEEANQFLKDCMNEIENKKLNEELIKNPSLLKSYLVQLLEKIKKIYPEIKSGDIRYDKDHPIYNKLTIHINDVNLSPKIKKTIDSFKKNLEQKEIMLSYKEYERPHVDFDEELNITAREDKYLEYVIYVKNIFTKRIKPARYVYHYGGRNGANEYNILKNGLIPKKHSASSEWSHEIQLEYPEAIFAVNGKEVWRESAVFRIDTQGLKNKWWTDLNFKNRDELIMTFEPIPASHIKRVYLVDGKLLEGKSEEIESGYEKIKDEINSIKYLIEDFGATLTFKELGYKSNSKSRIIKIYPSSGMLSNKEKRKEYIPLYEEFVERCEEICEENGFVFIENTSGGHSYQKSPGTMNFLCWMFSIKPKKFKIIKESVSSEMKNIMDEIYSIKYIMEDVGVNVVCRSSGELDLDPSNSWLGGGIQEITGNVTIAREKSRRKVKFEEYVSQYEEFVERCQEICRDNNHTFISDFGSGRGYNEFGKETFGRGKWLNWKFFIKPKKKI